MSITLAVSDLENETSYFLGYGRSYSGASSAQKSDVDSAVNAGLRMFYFPDNGYQWTFLQPQASVSAVASTAVYDLPADFASIVGDFTWPTTTGNREAIRVIPEFKLRSVQQGVTLSNQMPRFAAIVPKSGGFGITYSVEFDNPFDASYSIGYTYRVMPSSSTQLYGVSSHGETILAACLAAAEQRIDSRQDICRADFQRRLAASLAIDLQLKPNHTGSYYDKHYTRHEVRHESTGIPTFFYNGNPN